VQKHCKTTLQYTRLKHKSLKNENQKEKKEKDKTEADYPVVTSRHCHMIDEIKMFSVCVEKSQEMLQEITEGIGKKTGGEALDNYHTKPLKALPRASLETSYTTLLRYCEVAERQRLSYTTAERNSACRTRTLTLTA